MQIFFQKYELPLFFLLTYILSWWTVPFMNGGLFPYGPALAAVIIITLTSDRQGMRGFWARLTNFRVGWWYVVGPTIIAVYLFAAFFISLLMGARMLTPFPFPSVGTILILLIAGGLWEEPGWTGYALPKLQARFAPLPYGMLAATLAAGFFRSIWHLPLFLYGTLPWYDVFIFIFAFQIILSWIYNESGGNLSAVMITHYVSNVLTGSTMLLAFTGSEREIFYILFVIFACLAALVIIWKSQLKLGEENSA